jgi:hypothetical protein
MSRAGLGLALVWLLCAAPLFLQHSPGGESARLALALLPWLAWASLPRCGSEPELLDRLAPWLALPLLVLALGRAAPGSLAAAGALALLALLYFAAARRSARSVGGRRLYAAAWFALVAGAPLLAGALESAGAPLFGRPPGWLELLAQLSPLSCCAAPLRTGLPWMPLALGAGLWLAGRALEARE